MTSLLRRKLNEASPQGLLVDIIRRNPRGSELEHKSSFRAMVLKRGYENYLHAVIDEWQSLRYANCVRMILGVNNNNTLNKDIERKKKQFQARILLMIMLMPNGKILGDCSGSYLAKIGGKYSALAREVGKKTVRQVLTENDLHKYLD